MYRHKRSTAYLVLVGMLILIVVFSCSKKHGTRPIESPKLTLLSNHGAPGKTIQASVIGMSISSRSAFVVFDTVPAPIFAIEDQNFSFLVPLLPVGQYTVFLQDSLGMTSTRVSFNVNQQPATGQPPGKITTDMVSSTVELINIATTAGTKLSLLGILTPSDSVTLTQDLSRITVLLNSMQSEFSGLPDSVKTMVDAFLYAAGVSDILNTKNSKSPLSRCVGELQTALAASATYDSFYVLVALDNFSMVLSDLKAGLTVSAVAILIASSGTGAPASGVITAICFGISVLDNIIDGALPTDLDRLQVSFLPQNGPELNVGEKASVKVVGRFSTQKDPLDATVDIALSGLFYGIEINLAKQLKSVIAKLALKFAQVMAVSLDDVITNVRQITLPNPVSVDINYYKNDFDGMMAATGMTLLVPGVVVAFDVVSLIFNPNFGVVPLSFSTNAVSYNALSNQVTALTTGTLNATNVSVDAWSCKSLCSGLLSFLCFGAEWPKVIEHAQHTVQPITINAQTSDTTKPSAITNLKVSSVTSNSATLEWKAPGDDGNSGTATQYDIRYSTLNITESNWASATQCSGEPSPKPAGASELFVVMGLNPSTKYYFAIKTADEVPNWSGLSNVESTITVMEGIEFGEITDPRDTKKYKIVKIGSQWWMAENLNYLAESGCWCYNDSCNKYASIYGRLYNWKAACKSCPPGWHLPSAEEMQTLIGYLGGELVAGGKLKSTGTLEAGNGLWHSPNTGATNESGFEALPASCCGCLIDLNKYLGYETQFWTLQAVNCGELVCATFLQLYNDNASAIYVNEYWGGDQLGFSVRCIKNSVPDEVPPSLVYDLSVSSKTTHSITLSWTAPGDDGYDGSASQYDIRYSTSGIFESNWSSATQCTGEPIPNSAGSSESFVVTGLKPDTYYFIGMKTADEVPNWSNLSHVAQGRTPKTDDTTSPAAVTDLATSDPTSSSIKLTWTAPGDDSNSGTASQYDIRYSTSTITSSNWGSATQCSGEPSPKSAGGSESFTVTGLSPNTIYYFAMKTADELPNWSGLSNVVADSTSPGGAGAWSPLGSGTNGSVRALIVYDNHLIAGGAFTTAGAVGVDYVAAWDGSSWSSLGSGGVDDWVYAFTVYEDELIAGGDQFGYSGVATWDGSSWRTIWDISGGPVYAVTVYDNKLIAGGWYKLHVWDGDSSWSPLGSGVGGLNPFVTAFAVYNNKLIVGGGFTMAGGVTVSNIAAWDGSSWFPLGSGVDSSVQTLAVYDNKLIVGGRFITAGGITVNNIAAWDGSSWSPLGSGVGGVANPTVEALTVYEGNLIAGGFFKTAGDSTVYGIARWDGYSWSPLGSGMNYQVNALTVYNNRLIAGGYFTTAGGVTANHIAEWSK